MGGIKKAALEAAELYEDLGEVLVQPKRQAERVATSQSYGINISDEVKEARSEIRSMLVSWARMLIDEGLEPPADNIMDIARFIGNNVDWLHMLTLRDVCEEELILLRRPEWVRLAYPVRKTMITIGECECGGTYRYDTTQYAQASNAVCSTCNKPKPVTEFNTQPKEWVSVPEAAHLATFYGGIMVTQDSIRGMIRRGKLSINDMRHVQTTQIMALYERHAA